MCESLACVLMYLLVYCLIHFKLQKLKDQYIFIRDTPFKLAN